MKRLMVFDLDGTLAESKRAVDDEMAGLLTRLLALVQVAVISGGDWPQFEQQILARLAPGTDLAGLSLLPTSGTKFYRYDAGWTKLYAEDFSPDDRTRILRSLGEAVAAEGDAPGERWGETIEDRGSQITFSALGQEAPVDAKRTWDPDAVRRKRMKAFLDPRLPGFSVRIGGMTSVDITRAGIDKGYGIRKLRDTLQVPIRDMLFVGDALFPGGNDDPAREAGALAIRVRDPGDTKCVIETMIAFLGSTEGNGASAADPVKGKGIDPR